MEEYTFDQFAEKSGLLVEDELIGLGLEPDEDHGNYSFDNERLPELEAFVSQHPKYHIISRSYGVGFIFNSNVRNGSAYCLGDGSKEHFFAEEAVPVS